MRARFWSASQFPILIVLWSRRIVRPFLSLWSVLGARKQLTLSWDLSVWELGRDDQHNSKYSVKSYECESCKNSQKASKQRLSGEGGPSEDDWLPVLLRPSRLREGGFGEEVKGGRMRRQRRGRSLHASSCRACWRRHEVEERDRGNSGGVECLLGKEGCS